MSERKVLNKYYPPDFDPTKIPRARQSKNRQFTVRLMAPCNMRCDTCGEYIYKGKKFNARKEDVENETYLGIRIYRFYIKCTRCLAEISFKTDPINTDYVIEAGATRNFMALKLAEEQAQREEEAEKEEEATNPMKLLEKRTQASRNEMDVMEALEEIKELNQRQISTDIDSILGKVEDEVEDEEKKQEEADEEYIRSLFSKENVVKRLDENSDESDDEPDVKKFCFGSTSKPTSILVPADTTPKLKDDKSIGMLKVNKKSLVVVKPKADVSSKTPSSGTPNTNTVSSSSSQISNTSSVSVAPKITGKSNEPVSSLSLLGSAYDSSDSDSNSS